MHNNKYSRLSSKEIMTKDYIDTCSKFLNLTKDEKIKEKMKRNLI